MFRLIASVPAHEGPIKAINSNISDMVITGGQDSAVRIWSVERNSQGISFAESRPLYHSHWITAVTTLKPNCHPAYPNGLLVTGCMDNIIRLFDLSGNLIGQLMGHEKPVISFSWTDTYNLVSGSWDGTAKKWDIERFSCVMTYSGHENGVHVLVLENDLLVTVSTGESVDNKPANFRLRLWSLTRGNQLIQPIEDHNGPIRSIFSIPGLGFATTSNDGTLAFRDSSTGQSYGICAHQSQDEGYPPFLLDGTAIHFPDSISGAVTCGEDGSVMIWKGTEFYQSLPHPACVWAVCTLGGEGNEILTACHDGFLRLFSRDPILGETSTAIGLQTQFLDEIEAASVAKRRGPSQEEIQKSPKWELRGNIPGTSEGQVRIFNKDGIAIAAQWSNPSQVWIEIGEVTGNPGGDSDSGILNGARYDHIIPVEIETPGGVKELKLGYQDTESHFTAAQRFIDENVLDQGYLRQIADFIAARAGKSSQPTIDMSRGASSASQSLPVSNNPVQSFVPVASVSPSFRHFPATCYYSFDDIPNPSQLKKLYGKIIEFNEQQLTETDKLSRNDLDSLEDLLRIIGETSYYHSSVISISHLSPLMKMIQNWSDYRNLFPCYDLLRMICLHPVGATVLSGNRSLSLSIQRAVEIISKDSLSGSLSSSPQCLLALRFLANLFKNETLRSSSLSISSLFQSSLWSQFSSSLSLQFTLPNKKTHRYASLLLLCNLFFYHFSPSSSSLSPSLSSSASSTTLQSLFPALLTVISSGNPLDGESCGVDGVYKALVALGTVVTGTGSSSKEFLRGNSENIQIVLQNTLVSWNGEKEIVDCVKEIEKAYRLIV